MPSRAMTGLVVGLLVVAGCAGACSGPPDHAAAVTPTTLGELTNMGMVCSGPTRDHSAFAQWQCDRSQDAVGYSVVVDADDRHVKQVLATIDQTRSRTTSAALAGDFLREVAGLDWSGSSSEIGQWVAAHLVDGGQDRFGSVLVTLDRFQPVTHLTLFNAADQGSRAPRVVG